MQALHRSRLFRAVALVLVLVFPASLFGCASRQPLPQPRRVADPDTVPGSVKTSEFGIAAVGYTYLGEGLDYSKAGLDPVFLVFKNSSDKKFTVDYDQTRGVASDGSEYLPYSVDEATQLVTRSEALSNTTSNAARSGGLGAVLGAGIGALIGTIGGGDNIWKGAAIGAAGGAMAGGLYGGYNSETELKQSVIRELSRYAWTSEPVPQSYTKVGYLYFPGDVKIDKVKLLVRSGDTVTTYTLPVTQVFEQQKDGSGGGTK
ncbi:hypothetical protein dsx2_1605 [Desulfovibrio sp. X2]|uniref:glycine zipper domain-containing protein n=1 Tax=Desulfovibrio sp. X2 TaxID=941449 RepID=UPI000358DD81|nr:glycine zipper domain-containing protein [Desulfovibrio sp. X2]EPR44244.1 hypothetical protein dsx2_1605 [Desulfovibrio sp. X2]